MNKLFTKIAALALGAAMVVGVGVSVGSKSNTSEAYAVEYTDVYVLDTTDKNNQTDNNNYGVTGTGTFGGIEWTFTGNGKINPWRIGGKKASSGDQPFYTGTAISDNIVRVIVEFGSGNIPTYNSFKMTVHNNAADCASGSNIVETHDNLSFGANETATIDLTNAQSGKFYRFVPNVSMTSTSNKYLEVKTVTFQKVKSSGDSYSVTYLANGATGSVPVDGTAYTDSSNTVTVLGNVGGPNNDGSDPLIKTGYTFLGWTHGTNFYEAGDTFSISANVQLTAKWYLNDSISAKESSYEIYTSSTLNLSNCVTAAGDGELSFTVPSANYLTYDSATTTITGDSSNTGGPLTITAYKGTASCTFTVSVVERPSSGTFELFSGSIESGEYIIVSGSVALKAALATNTNYIGYETVVISNDKIVNPSSDLIWKVEASGDYWTLYNEQNTNYAASTGAKNKGKVIASPVSDADVDKTLWTVSGSSTYEFVNKANDDSSVNSNLRYNPGYGFACYSTSTGSSLSLYKLAEPAKKIADTRLTTASGSITASVGATKWTVTGFVFEVQYEGESTWNAVVPTYVVSESVPTSYTDVGEYGVHFKVTYQGTDYHAGTSFTASVTANVTSLKDFHDGTITLKTSRNSLTDSDYYLVRGTVVGINGYQYYIQEGSYGLLVFNESNYHDTYYSTIALGDYVYVYSQVYKYYNLVETSSRGTKQSVEKVGTQTLPDAAEFSTVASFMAGNQSVRASLYNTAIDSTNLATIADFSGSSTLDQQFTAYDANSSSDTVTVFISKNVAADDKAAIVTKLQKITADDKVDFVRTVVAYYNGNQISLSSADQIIIHTPAEDKLLSWGTNYLFIGNPDFDGDGTGLCKTNNYYKDAKIQLFILEKEESGSITKLQSESEYAELLDRYTDWATACGDTKPFVEDYNFLNPSMIPSIISSESTATAIIIIVSVIGVSALGGFFFLRKRKEI